MKYGYAKVSTVYQDLDAQLQALEDTPTGRLVFNVMSAFAEFERDMIVERTQEGKPIANSVTTSGKADRINSLGNK
jgi:DNA invertase Pin-like site-specific DNA recombinase